MVDVKKMDRMEHTPAHCATPLPEGILGIFDKRGINHPALWAPLLVKEGSFIDTIDLMDVGFFIVDCWVRVIF